MKKLLVLFLTLILCSMPCFALSYKLSRTQQKAYRQEIEPLIDKEIINAKSELDKINNSSNKIYQDFLKNKNQMKINYGYVNQLENFERETDSPEFYLYLKLIDVTDKYIKIKDSTPSTDFSGALFNFIYPYLKKNKVNNLDKILELTGYAGIIQHEIETKKTAIYDYSVEYETTKNQNYISKFEKRIEHLDDNIIFQQTGTLNKNVIYTTRAQVFQILSNGVLASTASGQGKVIYIQTNKAHDLAYGDVFLPCIPLRFTGQYYTYTTLTGMRNRVPMFKEILPTEYKRITNFVSPADKYYFIAPYYIETQPFDIVLKNYYYPLQDRYFRRGY